MPKARIEKVIIENIKSFNTGEISFPDGIIIISGKNGSGKSTIFEAIGFCLFNVSPQSFIGKMENFIHHGETKGNVVVEIMGVDGESYRIERTTKNLHILKKKSSDGWFPLNISKKELTDFVHKILGLYKARPLADQFKDIIGPFQSEFTTPFLYTRGKREQYFDEVLGISQWRNIYSKTSPWKRIISNKIENIEIKISEKSKAIEDLEDQEKELKEAKSSLEKMYKDKAKTEKEKEEAHSILEEYEKRRKRKEELLRKKGRLEAQRQEIRRSYQKTQKNLTKAQQSKEIIAKVESDYKLHIDAEKKRDKLQKRIKNKNELEKKLKEKELRHKRLETSIKEKKLFIEEQKRKLSNELEEVEKKLRENQNKLAEKEEELKKVRHTHETTKGLVEKLTPSTLNLSQKRIEDLEKRLLVRLENIQESIKQKKEEIKKRAELEKIVSRKDSIEKLLEEKKRELTILEIEVQNLEKIWSFLEKGTCPFLKEECLNIKQKGLPQKYKDKNFFEAEITKVSEEIKSLQEEITHIKDAENKLQEIEVLKRKLEDEEVTLKEEIKNIASLIEDIDIQEHVNHLLTVISKNLTYFPSSITEEAKHFPLKPLKFCIDRARDSIKDMKSYIATALQFEEKIISHLNDYIKEKESLLEEILQGKSTLEGKQVELNKRKKEIQKTIKNTHKDEEKLVKLEKDLKKIRLEIKTLEEEKSLYAGLEEEIEKVELLLKKSAEGYQKYMENIKLAKEVTKLKKEINSLEKELKEIDDTLKEVEKEVSSIEKSYSDKELEEAKKKHRELIKKYTEIDTKISHMEEEISRLSSEIAKKKKIKEEIAQLHKEREEWEETLGFVDFLRERVFKCISSEVGDVLRSHISGIASEIYRTISGKSEELVWGEGYSLNLIDIVGGKRRVRTDRQLSGGQFMTAVISIRLALLQMVGSPFAFFDEPTSNLDEERRKNLAEAFRRLNKGENRWYRQMFLVSHDESFQEISGTNIELYLDERGCSKISSPLLVNKVLTSVKIS